MCRVVTTELIMSNLSLEEIWKTFFDELSSVGSTEWAATDTHQFFLFFVFFGNKDTSIKTAYRLYVQTYLTGDRSGDYKRPGRSLERKKERASCQCEKFNLSNLMFKINTWEKTTWPSLLQNMTTCFRHNDEWKYKTVQYCASAKVGGRTKLWNLHTHNITSDLWPFWWNDTFLTRIELLQ